MSGNKEENGGPMYQQLRKFISIIDELRDVGLQQHIKLPRIVVLGSQSAGKSSVLESIVGIDFLPRGDGVVTRRPLELRLNHNSDLIEPWAKFEEVPNKKFTNFGEVKDTINFLTDKVCGQSKNIIDKPIVLTIYSHTCPDLTLVDLPGITRIPMAGSDQPDNIEQITRAMANRYVSDSRTIILCVLPANADMTTSDGLQMAREVDKKGLRTIGVITKIDIMDRGTNAKRMIEGKDVALRLGFIGIKNRSQQDIIDRISVKEAIEKEQLYFGTHPVYSSMPQDLLGINNLTTKLTKILFTHIKHNLPEIMKEIRSKAKEVDDDLRDLGPPMPSSPGEKTQLLWNMITEFMQTYRNTISGKYDSRRYNSGSGQKQDLSGGFKIKRNFYELYQDFSDSNVLSDYSEADIEKAIRMHEGDGLPGFPSVDVFIFLINPQLEKLRDPALELVQETYSLLEQIAHTIVDKIFMRVPTIIPEIMDIIVKVLSKDRDHARDLVESIIDAEQNYLFTNDQEYKESRSDIVTQNDARGPNDPQGNPGRQQQQRGNQFVQELRTRIDSYFKLVLRSVKDSVPKAIGQFLVRNSQDALQFELFNQAQGNQQLASCLGEPASITERRLELTTMLTTLKNSMKVLQRDPDISAAGTGDEELEAMLRQEAINKKPVQQNVQQQKGQPIMQRPATGQQQMGNPQGNPQMRGQAMGHPNQGHSGQGHPQNPMNMNRGGMQGNVQQRPMTGNPQGQPVQNRGGPIPPNMQGGQRQGQMGAGGPQQNRGGAQGGAQGGTGNLFGNPINPNPLGGK